MAGGGVWGPMMDRLFGGGGPKVKTKQAAVELAPVGYDPTKGDDDQAPVGEGIEVLEEESKIKRLIKLWPWVVAFAGVVVVAGFVLGGRKSKAENITATPITPSPVVIVATITPSPFTATSTPIPTKSATNTPTATITPPPSSTITPTATATWTAIPTSTPTWTPLPTATETPKPWPTSTPTPAPVAKLANGAAVAGEQMVITGQVNNGSIVQIKWESGDLLAQVTPRQDGTWAASFVVPWIAAKGYHLIRVEWTGGGVDLVIALAVPTYTPTPIPLPTSTPIPTGTPTPTPTPGPTLDPSKIQCRLFLPLVFK